MRLSLLFAFLGMLGGCNTLPGVPRLGDPESLAMIKARFKATIAAELPGDAQPDWGTDGRNFWLHFQGPNSVEFCGRPANAPPGQRAYHINYSRGYFAAAIDEIEVLTPARSLHLSERDGCGDLDKRRRQEAYPSIYDLNLEGR